MELNNSLLKNLFLKKYKNSVFKKKNYVNRLNLQMNILSLRKKNKNHQKHFCSSCRYYKNENLWKNENILRLYKKFNVYLKLKHTYNNNLLSNTSREACLQTYLIFLNKVYISKKFNNFQKLNTILKINDLVVVKFFNDYANFNLLHINNFSLEHKLIRKLLS